MPVRQEWSSIDLCGADRRKKIGEDGHDPLVGHFVNLTGRRLSTSNMKCWKKRPHGFCPFYQ